MSRSVHTTPIEIRAARRVRTPFASRGDADPRRSDRLRRSLREAGLAAEPGDPRHRLQPAIRLPRIDVSRADSPAVHAVTIAEVRRTLTFFGASSGYGLRSIELLPRPAAEPGLRLGRYIAPGTVRLYAVEASPWLLSAPLAGGALDRMRLYRAEADVSAGRGSTVIRWPSHSLRDFVLIEVLMHEIGHHIIQQYTGKRPARVRRTRDHEAFAERFAERCRLRYQQARPLG